MEISVRAEATGRRPPERALASIRVAHESDDQVTASRRATELVHQVVALLDEHEAAHPDAVVRRVVGPLGTRSWRPWNDEGTPLPPRFEASASLAVELSDVDVLAALLHQAALVEGVSLDSPWWFLTDESRLDLEAEVTRTAVGLARRRAELMARASGLDTVVPLHVADTGLLAEPAPQTMAMAAAAPLRARAAGDESFDLTPRDVELSVTLEARFRAQ